jgi:hypothetical protein
LNKTKPNFAKESRTKPNFAKKMRAKGNVVGFFPTVLLVAPAGGDFISFSLLQLEAIIAVFSIRPAQHNRRKRAGIFRRVGETGVGTGDFAAQILS